MSLEAILARIETAGEAQVQEIRLKAEQEAQAALAEARSLAQLLYQSAYRQALKPASGACARLLNQARFEALCQVGEVRENLIQSTLEEVSQRLENIRASGDYPAALQRILFEILPGEDGSHPVKDRLLLEADPRDRELLERLLSEKGLELRVDYILRCWGGLNARSIDGNARVLNTLESRLERVMPSLRQSLAAWFEQKPAGEEEDQPLAKAGLVKSSGKGQRSKV